MGMVKTSNGDRGDNHGFLKLLTAAHLRQL